MLKYHCTELARRVTNDAMDVQGGKGIMLGRSNYLARIYQGIPIAITVEGANILTRSLIIFGQGAVRCHPFVLKEMEAATMRISAAACASSTATCLPIWATRSAMRRGASCGAQQCAGQPRTHRRSDRTIFPARNRYSAAFALLADVAMLVVGGGLKRKEMLSARLGDVFSCIYLASMVLKHYDNQGRQSGDLPLVEWACRTLLYQAQEQLHGFLRNFPNRWVAALLRDAFSRVAACTLHRPMNLAGRSSHWSPSDRDPRAALRRHLRGT